MAKKVNFSKFIREFKVSTNNLLNEIDLAMGQSFENVVNDAKSKAPTDFKGNDIGSSISLTRTSKLKYRIKVGNKYAAYYEFGTGPSAKQYLPSIPEEWREIAAQFKTPIPGRIKVNKYLYPSYNDELPRLMERIQNIIRNA
jgi:hypothetical protein